ncbi:MAG: hypothetical protein WCG55_03400 [bacterium]
MKKYSNVLLKIVFSLILLIPILGAVHVFPAPTQEMYNNPRSFAFIQMLMDSASYINYIMAFVFGLSLVLVWTKRMALAALLVLPITVNIVAFHAFLDGGLITSGAIPGVVFAVLNGYFLWQQRAAYSQLFAYWSDTD